jgi:hypothetical protein
MQRYRFSLVVCARWEDDDIQEWVSYHQMIGFDHIFLYINEDDPRKTLKALQCYIVGPDPFVTVVQWPKAGVTKPQQHKIYLHFLQYHKSRTEWFGFLDVDEFYILKNDKTIAKFMEPFVEACYAVYFNWVIYGSEHKPHRTTDSILLTHTHRARNIDPHTKVLTRSSSIDPLRVERVYGGGKAKGFWHFWDAYFPEMRILNVISDDMRDYSGDFPARANQYVKNPAHSEPILQQAYIAHFQFKSEEDFLRRVNRGGSHTVALWKRTLEDGSYLDRLQYANEIWDVHLARMQLSLLGSSIYFSVDDEFRCFENYARLRPSAQSSVEFLEFPGLNNLAQHHANDGLRGSFIGCCTKLEENPWWMVDLLEDKQIKRITIYHRMELNEKFPLGLNVELSLDRVVWINKHSIFPVLPEKAVDFICDAEARYVRLSGSGWCHLLLEEVEIMGEKPL